MLFRAATTTKIYTLSLHDALPISHVPEIIKRLGKVRREFEAFFESFCSLIEIPGAFVGRRQIEIKVDRKSTRLNSSHVENSYAVFCLKKKTKSRDDLAVR